MRRRTKDRVPELLFRLLDVRNDFLGRLNDAAAQPGKRERRAHDFQERAPLDWVIPLFSVLRIFAAHKLFEDR
jgi:hypothetical protein